MTAKVAVALPAPTVTEAGIVAEELLLDSETEIPPVGAAPLKVTVPVAAVPPLTLEGLIERDVMETLTVVASDKVTVLPAAIATLS